MRNNYINFQFIFLFLKNVLIFKGCILSSVNDSPKTLQAILKN